MDQPEEIALNYLVDNPLVAIYNAEPTWQSGFLKVSHHLISVALGLAWLILRLILMLIIWIWNNVTFYFPEAQLPDAELVSDSRDSARDYNLLTTGCSVASCLCKRPPEAEELTSIRECPTCCLLACGPCNSLRPGQFEHAILLAHYCHFTEWKNGKHNKPSLGDNTDQIW